MDAISRMLEEAAEWNEARAALEECREIAGYEAGYFCSDAEVRVERAVMDFKAAFRDAVREIIEAPDAWAPHHRRPAGRVHR